MVKHVPRVWEFWSYWRILYCTALQTVHRRFNIYTSILVQWLHCLDSLTLKGHHKLLTCFSIIQWVYIKMFCIIKGF